MGDQDVLFDVAPDPEVTRRCTKCLQVKPLSAYQRNPKQRGGLTTQCKACYRAYYKMRQAEDPSFERNQRLWYKYRLRGPAYDAMLAAQMSRCAICGDPLKSGPEVHLDHNHECDHPGKGRDCCAECVRGILCRSCNGRILPVIEGDPALLAAAIRYLGVKGLAILDDIISGMAPLSDGGEVVSNGRIHARPGGESGL